MPSLVNVNVHLQGNGGVRAVVEYVLGKVAEGEVRRRWGCVRS